MSTEAKPVQKKSMSEVLKNAGTRALGGGVAGAMAMACQVTTLMWLRTTMNYQVCINNLFQFSFQITNKDLELFHEFKSCKFINVEMLRTIYPNLNCSPF